MSRATAADRSAASGPAQNAGSRSEIPTRNLTRDRPGPMIQVSQKVGFFRILIGGASWILQALTNRPPSPLTRRTDERRAGARSRSKPCSMPPFNDLLHRAHSVHRSHFDPNAVQLSTLLSVKTGGCPEDCGYCPQAARYHTGVANEDMLSVEQVTAAARLAKANGATRFCMGAAWRGPEAARARAGGRDGESRARGGPGNLRDAGAAEGGAGRAAQGRGPRLLQPQHRHRARVLRRDHHDAHPGRPPGDARARARRRHPRLLRRHRRHGRIARAPARR